MRVRKPVFSQTSCSLSHFKRDVHYFFRILQKNLALILPLFLPPHFSQQTDTKKLLHASRLKKTEKEHELKRSRTCTSWEQITRAKFHFFSNLKQYWKIDHESFTGNSWVYLFWKEIDYGKSPRARPLVLPPPELCCHCHRPILCYETTPPVRSSYGSHGCHADCPRGEN